MTTQLRRETPSLQQPYNNLCLQHPYLQYFYLLQSSLGNLLVNMSLTNTFGNNNFFISQSNTSVLVTIKMATLQHFSYTWKTKIEKFRNIYGSSIDFLLYQLINYFKAMFLFILLALRINFNLVASTLVPWFFGLSYCIIQVTTLYRSLSICSCMLTQQGILPINAKNPFLQ